MKRLGRLGAVIAAVACVAVVVAYQATRPASAVSNPVVFIPSPAFYERLSPSTRLTVADVYWLYTIQYYGEHVDSDHRLDSLPAMIDLVSELSPHFREPYFFGAFSSIDRRDPGWGYDLLQRGAQANPRDWRFPFSLGFFAYTFASDANKDRVAAAWYAKAAQLGGGPAYLPRLAAELAQKGNERQKAIDLWTQVYAQGDKYAREKAVAALDKLLPRDKVARQRAVAGLKDLVPPAQFDQFVAELFQAYL